MGLIKPEIYDSLYRDEQFTKYECLFELGVEFKGTILDAGCGTALLYEYVESNRGETGAKYVCLDPDPEMLKIAGAKVRSPLIILIEGYAEELPFRNDAFDLIVSISTWGVLSRTPSMLKDLKSALRMGGVIVVTGHPKTYHVKPRDVDESFFYVGQCIDDFYMATR
ncbi:MAG: class I SAM-dependent methyltransferase [Desulfurococcaceae archaeon]